MTPGIGRPGRARGRGPRPPMTGQLHGLPLDRAPGAPPLYAQIRDGIRSAILTGALAPGMRLPPERELAASLGVNRTTTMRAYHELAADGVVEARPAGARSCARPRDGRTAPPTVTRRRGRNTHPPRRGCLACAPSVRGSDQIRACCATS